MRHWAPAPASHRSAEGSTGGGPRHRAAHAGDRRRSRPPAARPGLRRGAPILPGPLRRGPLRGLYLARLGAVEGLRGGGTGAPPGRCLGLHAPELLHGVSRDPLAGVPAARTPSTPVGESRWGRWRRTRSERRQGRGGGAQARRSSTAPDQQRALPPVPTSPDPPRFVARRDRGTLWLRRDLRGGEALWPSTAAVSRVTPVNGS